MKSANKENRSDPCGGVKDLGFVEGNEIHVVSSSGANIIVTVLGARFGIDSKVAMHIMTVG